jgi:hypothetical protein
VSKATIAFDFQQNIPVRQLVVNDVFYARQLWVYNMGIQPRYWWRNCVLYMWPETEVEFCTGPGLALGPEPDPDSTDNVRVCAGFGYGSNYSNQTLYRIFRAFSGNSFFAKKKLFLVALILCSWHNRGPETNPTYLTFSGIFVAAPSQK